MLRLAVLVVGLALLAVGVGTWLGGAPGTVPLIVWGALLSAAVVFERWRYRPSPPPPEAGWEETDERFVDPETGAAMRVLFNPRTGERRYQPLTGQGPGS